MSVFCVSVYAAPVLAADRAGAVIEIKTAIGTYLNAYLVGPENATKSVILVHDRWGLDQHTLDWTDRLAEHGFLALAIDLYDGRSAKKRNYKHASLIMGQIDPEWSDVNLKAAVNFIKNKTLLKPAVLGWGFGGGMALRAALLEPASVASTVIFYGPVTMDTTLLDDIEGAVLGVFSTKDEWVSPSKVDAFTNLMRRMRNAIVLMNVDAAPGFVDPSLSAYDDEVAERAWQRSLEFLNETL